MKKEEQIEIVQFLTEIIKKELPVYRDEQDVEAIRKKDNLIGLLAIFCVILSLISGVLYFKRPTVNTIIKTIDGQRVISINDKEFGCGEPIELGQDHLSNDDKTYLSNQFAKWIYGVYLPSRDSQIESALNLIEDKKFLKEYSQQLTSGQLQVEKSEQWNAVWQEQKITVDDNNPMLIRIIGTQKLSRIINNVSRKEDVQYELTIELTTDNKRDDNDLRTGFRILHFKGTELGRTEANI